jgi:hypothetical protein
MFGKLTLVVAVAFSCSTDDSGSYRGEYYVAGDAIPNPTPTPKPTISPMPGVTPKPSAGPSGSPSASPTPTPTGIPLKSGELSTVTAVGRVTGWAIDPANLNAMIDVSIYVDGPEGSGILAAETVANLSGFDGGNGNRHAFAVNLDPEFNTGTARMIYVYADVGGMLKPIGQKSYTSYAPKDAGRTFFANNLQNTLTQRCGGCHGVGYEQQYADLIQPPPDQGGTALNNLLLNKPSAQVAHGGGNICGGANGAPCSLFQQWWTIEFGN